ncbi:MAG: neutral zinc metallopeptidase [Planctomycetia bacterium]|nr:neutral zinc metallopeptidase [Planctomycetia bacterium]
MRWEGRAESGNVEDRRSLGKAGLAVGGLGSVVLVILGLLFGVDPQMLVQLDPGQPQGQVNRPVDPAEERLASFSKVIFRDTEVVWDEQFQKLGRRYEKPVLVLFSGQVDSACGSADSAVGPFYCPGDARVYIDLSFYRDMQRKLNAPGEFARAYVIAHEVGHHVQRLLGYSKLVDNARRSGSRLEANRMSVRLELQADFLAGVWAHHGQRKFQFLEQGDIESALNAAFEIGDDRLQKKGRGYVVPDSFTHGTSKQRMRWFMEGYRTGDVNQARKLFDLPYDQL